MGEKEANEVKKHIKQGGDYRLLFSLLSSIWRSFEVCLMFCADYIASFIHHGILAGLWCEYKKLYQSDKVISTQDVPAFQCFISGCLSGNVIYFIKLVQIVSSNSWCMIIMLIILGLFGAASVYPLDFVRQGAIINEKVRAKN